MRISLFESDDTIFFRIFDALLSEVTCRTADLDINTLDLLLHYYIDYKFLLGEIYEKFPFVVIFLSGGLYIVVVPVVLPTNQRQKVRSPLMILFYKIERAWPELGHSTVVGVACIQLLTVKVCHLVLSASCRVGCAANWLWLFAKQLLLLPLSANEAPP